MKKQSTKYQARMREKNKAFAEFDENNDGICKGCGQYRPGSHSHIVPVSEAPELEAVVENITWDCMSCHLLWETHNIEQMSKLLNFEERMNYIKRVRPMYYERLISKS